MNDDFALPPRRMHTSRTYSNPQAPQIAPFSSFRVLKVSFAIHLVTDSLSNSGLTSSLTNNYSSLGQECSTPAEIL